MPHDTNKILEPFLGLPRFKDGRIDYTHSVAAPVFSCFLFHKNKLLLLKRSDKVGAYQGSWNVVTSFIDQPKPLEKLVRLELQEEAGITPELISSIAFQGRWKYFDRQNGRSWIIYPALAKCDTSPQIRLNWENTDWKWIYPRELLLHSIVPGLDRDLDMIFDSPDWRNTPPEQDLLS